MVTESIERMVRQARIAQMRAYAPYSKFMVGAAVLTRTGSIYAGCNVESADHDGTHAEEAALCAMVMGNERSPLMVMAFGALEGEEPTIVMPCGKCRQKLWEFASLIDDEILVVTLLLSDGTFDTKPLSVMLQDAFGPADIGVDLAKYRR